MIRTGKRLDHIRLMVSPNADISKLDQIDTAFGPLVVSPGEYIPKGYAYLIERPLSQGGIGFQWVVKQQAHSKSG